MAFIAHASPRHFGGELTVKMLGSSVGLHNIEVQLADHGGGIHVVYLSYGRGDAGAQAARAAFGALVVGGWYTGSATLLRKTADRTEWGGHVSPLLLCRNRQRFMLTAQAAA